MLARRESRSVRYGLVRVRGRRICFIVAAAAAAAATAIRYFSVVSPFFSHSLPPSIGRRCFSLRHACGPCAFHTCRSSAVRTKPSSLAYVSVALLVRSHAFAPTDKRLTVPSLRHPCTAVELSGSLQPVSECPRAIVIAAAGRCFQETADTTISNPR